jgi:phospholipase/lecithinase/hemolysin
MTSFPPVWRRLITAVAFVATALAALPASAGSFSAFYLFGDSLSDSGNNAIFLGIDAGQVITGNDYIPTQPYASGRYSNAEVWTASFAAGIAQPALASLSGGNVYAYGGARTRIVGPDGTPALRTQVSVYLAAAGGVADKDALYVIEGGGNNARDTLESIAAGAPLLATLVGDSLRYGLDVKLMVDRLRSAGAEHIVVWNTPDLAIAPAIVSAGSEAVALAGVVTQKMNGALAKALAGTPGVTIFDAFGLFDLVVARPVDYGLVNVTDACGATPACEPSTYLFWDGIHPTSAGHAIIANAMLAVTQSDRGWPQR